MIAPAMNVHMWRAETTREAVATLRARGAVVVEPESGELACGDVGEGRLAALDDDRRGRARRGAALARSRRRARAGDGRPDAEPIDPVRFIGNASSGKTGYAIAEEAARRGADGHARERPDDAAGPVRRAHRARHDRGADARRRAVGVYRRRRRGRRDRGGLGLPTGRAALRTSRRRTTAPLTLELERTPDILARARRRQGRALPRRIRRRDARRARRGRGQARREEPRPRGRQRRLGARDSGSARTPTASGSSRPTATEELPVMSQDDDRARRCGIVSRRSRATRRRALRTGKGRIMTPRTRRTGQAALRLRRRRRDLRRQAALPGAHRPGAHCRAARERPRCGAWSATAPRAETSPSTACACRPTARCS